MIRSIAAGIAFTAVALAVTPASAGLLDGNASASASAQSGAIDINVATSKQLKAVGFTKAQADQIVALAKKDPFETVDELKAEVSTVSDDTLAKLKGQVSIGTTVVGNVTAAAGGLVGGVTGAVGGAADTAGGIVKTATTPVNVNTATVAQLQQMGISLQGANSIVATVKKNGPVTSIDALATLPGVDAKQLGALSAQGSLTIQ
jgi:DNA uptake protein ComE-like DNA-binding protein